MDYFNEGQLGTIADALVTQGYVVIDDALPQALLDALVMDMDQLHVSEFKRAGIGRLTDFQLQDTVRSDKIYWLESNTNTTTEFLQWMESLRVGINRRLFMGLFDYESHFAHYPIGAFYKKHMDAFRENKTQGQSNRVLSTVLYLNESWQPDQRGELLIYDDASDQVMETVLPTLGRLVIFLSEKFPHEVLPATRERKSIAGWFRVNQGAI